MKRLGSSDFITGLLVVAQMLLPSLMWAQFETRGSIPVLPGPTSVAVGDFNHDGKLDMAVASELTATVVSVFLGNGDGTFRPAVNYEVGNGPDSVAAADFNRDGNLDLAVVSIIGDPNTVSVLLGNGDGTFQPAKTISASDALSVWVADVNGDGLPDLLLSTLPYVTVLIGNGDGTFQGAMTTLVSGLSGLATGDFNGDGKLDFAAGEALGGSSLVGIFLGNGDGTFQTGPTYPIGQSPEAVVVADLNGDTKQDLAIITQGSGVDVLLGNGNGTFRAASNYLTNGAGTWIATGDFNGDGNLDFVVSQIDHPSGISVLLGMGDGTFVEPSMYFADGKQDRFVNVGDFNNDGKLDIVVPDYRDSQVIIVLNTGLATFTPNTPLNFLTQVVGTTSPKISVTLTNEDTKPLSISSIKVQGEFKIEGISCARQVAPGSSCQIQANFEPTSIGPKVGFINIVDSASSKPQVVELVGAGTVVTVSPRKMKFPDQKVGTKSPPQKVQVTNHSGKALTISQIDFSFLTDSRDFSQTNNCGSTLAAGASCTVSIEFAPMRTGFRSSTLEIFDDGGGSPQTMTAAGTGN